MRSLLTRAEDEKRSLTTDEAKQFDDLRSQSDVLNAEIARYEVLSDEERNQVKNQTANEKLSNDELRNYILTGETRSLSTGVPVDGGYTVIPELNKQIMQQLADESVMRQICTLKTTCSNEYKQLVSVGGAAVAHGEEGKTRCETATPKMEEVSIKLFPIYAYPKTTQEIIDFSDVDNANARRTTATKSGWTPLRLFSLRWLNLKLFVVITDPRSFLCRLTQQLTDEV